MFQYLLHYTSSTGWCILIKNILAQKPIPVVINKTTGSGSRQSIGFFEPDKMFRNWNLQSLIITAPQILFLLIAKTLYKCTNQCLWELSHRFIYQNVFRGSPISISLTNVDTRWFILSNPYFPSIYHLQKKIVMFCSLFVGVGKWIGKSVCKSEGGPPVFTHLKIIKSKDLLIGCLICPDIPCLIQNYLAMALVTCANYFCKGY